MGRDSRVYSDARQNNQQQPSSSSWERLSLKLHQNNDWLISCSFAWRHRCQGLMMCVAVAEAGKWLRFTIYLQRPCVIQGMYIYVLIYIRIYNVYNFIDIRNLIVRTRTSLAVCVFPVQGMDGSSLSVCMVLTELCLIVSALDFRSVRRSLAWHGATMEGRCGDCGKTLWCHIQNQQLACVRPFSMQPQRHEGVGPCGVR